METNNIDTVKLTDVSRSEVNLPKRPEVTKEAPPEPEKPTQEVSSEPKEVSEPIEEKEVKEVVDFLNNSSSLFNLSLSFKVSFNEEIDRVIVSVYDKETDEVVKQIPSEEVVALAERLNEMVGVFFNETA
jgi:flagellar protein FlaG